MLVDRLKADIVIFGGGFMGLALAKQALIQGLKPLIVERKVSSTPHYMTGLLAPRADYLRLDKEEVELTAHECLRWLKMFPDVVKSKLFILPFSPKTPYSYNFLRPLMEYYDKLTYTRLGNNFCPSFRIDSSTLEQMEPNLRKNYFDNALGFYELTAEPNELLHRLRKELMTVSSEYFISYPDKILGRITDKRIENMEFVFKGRTRRLLIDNPKGFTIVNCAGPWMGTLPGFLSVDLPVEYSLGFQIILPEKYLFQNPIITFGSDGKYTIIYQNKDHLQVGPTNTPSRGPKDINDKFLQGKAKEYLLNILKETVDAGLDLKEAGIKSGGLRLKLRLPLTPDSNRPFMFRAGLENYYALYPGKAVLSLKTADEFLGNIIEKKKLSICLNGGKRTGNWFKLNWIWLKSMIALGAWYYRDFQSHLKLKDPV